MFLLNSMFILTVPTCWAVLSFSAEERERQKNLWKESVEEHRIKEDLPITRLLEPPTCQAQKEKLDEYQSRLAHVKNTLLDGIDCDDENCTKIVILSIGDSSLRHPPRFGYYTLHTMYKGFPVYYRKASDQYLFYKTEYDKWDYSHRIERWIIGPRIGDTFGGLTFLSKEKCPWNIDFTYKDKAYFFNKMVYNTWNPDGNGWKLENKISIDCYDEAIYPFYRGCDKINVTSEERILKYHPEKVGVYELVPDSSEDGFQAPVWKKKGNDIYPDDEYLYSHHPGGKLWLFGKSYTSWSIRLNLIENDHAKGSFYPPKDPLPPGGRWEYIHSRNKDGDEIWLKDDAFNIVCI